MKKVKIQLSELLDFLGSSVIRVLGETAGVIIDNVSDVNNVNEMTLDWINPAKSNKQDIANGSKARVILVDETIDSIKGKTLIVVKDPKRVLIEVIKRYFSTIIPIGIDQSAYIHPKAVIGKNNYIGPNCYIGNCIIGDNNIIHSNVCIYDRTRIGNNNVIHSGALICVDGLGCVREVNGTLTEFPQLGGVVIGDNCYLGGGVHIASGSLSDTVIENGCKINGLSFIGSNDYLHENVWITGSTMLAGSVKVGRNTNIFSRVVVRDWVKIGECVTIGMGAVVTKDIPSGETWVGNPARKMEKK